ncbi:Lar family restriction alleviation protein [Aliivibrio salmonicida]|uniref:Lar family restriction alleviation protein n=1 Tax=Aliivibrio salmonicida TaxID=40269 RepID=UPI003D0C3BD2
MNVVKLRPYKAAFKEIEHTKIKLEPCPFCKGKAILEQDMNEKWYVACNNQNCLVHPITNEFESKRHAVIAWNYRG